MMMLLLLSLNNKYVTERIILRLRLLLLLGTIILPLRTEAWCCKFSSAACDNNNNNLGRRSASITTISTRQVPIPSKLCRFVVSDPEDFESFIDNINHKTNNKSEKDDDDDDYDNGDQNEKNDNKKSTTTSSSVVRRPEKLPFRTGLKYLRRVSQGLHPQYQTELMNQYGDCYIIWNKYVTLTNAKAIHDVLETHHNLEKPPDVTDALKVMFAPTGGILAAPWKEWIQQRRLTTPALSESVIGSIAPKLKRGADPMLAIFEQAAKRGTTLEMDEVFTSFTMDTIGLITLGQTFGMLDRILVRMEKDEDDIDTTNDGDDDDFTKALDIISKDAIRQSVSPRWVLKLWKSGSKVQRAKAKINSFLEDAIRQRQIMSEEERSQQPATDLLNILLEAESNGKITRDDLKAQLITFIFAGYDTTAHTLSYMLYEIAMDPDLQTRIFEEAKQALPNRDDFPLDPSIVANRLNLLDCAWLETLRKHPATASGVSRIVGTDGPIVVGDGLEIPAGVQISIPSYALHRNLDYWPDPETFDCSRWTVEEQAKRTSGDNKNKLSFIPFGAGARSCMGSRLARLEALSAMSTLFRRFEVTCVETEEPIGYTSLTTKPRDGIRFGFKARE